MEAREARTKAIHSLTLDFIFTPALPLNVFAIITDAKYDCFLVVRNTLSSKKHWYTL